MKPNNTKRFDPKGEDLKLMLQFAKTATPTTAEVATKLGVAKSTVSNWARRYREEHNIKVGKDANRKVGSIHNILSKRW